MPGFCPKRLCKFFCFLLDIRVAQAMVNFRMDEALKGKMEKTCKNMGLTVTAAYTMFATKVTREQRIPLSIRLRLIQ